MTNLANFRRPPVTEVALAVQFEPLAIGAVDFGLFRESFRSDYPNVQEHPKRPPMTADGGPQFTFELRGGMDSPNVHFVNDDGDRLVQLQSDRLVANWRRRPDESYPRYEKAIRPTFVDAWNKADTVAASLGVGPMKPNICEVVYVNLITPGESWRGRGDDHLVLAPWSGRYSDAFLPDAQEIRISAKYPIADGAGWLNIESKPLLKPDTGESALLLQLAARGRAETADLEGALGFLDLGRKSIVQGFVSFTESVMHEEWGML